MIVPTKAGSVTEDSEVYQEDARRDACNDGDETSFAQSVQFKSGTTNFSTESLELDQGVLPRCE